MTYESEVSFTYLPSSAQNPNSLSKLNMFPLANLYANGGGHQEECLSFLPGTRSWKHAYRFQDESSRSALRQSRTTTRLRRGFRGSGVIQTWRCMTPQVIVLINRAQIGHEVMRRRRNSRDGHNVTGQKRPFWRSLAVFRKR